MIRAPGERLLAAVLRAQRHQAGHFLLGETDLLAAELGERQILHLVRFAAGRLGGGERMKLLDYSCHSCSLFFNSHSGPHPRACHRSPSARGGC